MLLGDVLKEFVFECEIRRLSKLTIEIYRNNGTLFLINATTNTCSCSFISFALEF